MKVRKWTVPTLGHQYNSLLSLEYCIYYLPGTMDIRGSMSVLLSEHFPEIQQSLISPESTPPRLSPFILDDK